MSDDEINALLSKSHRRLLDGDVDYDPTDSRGRGTRSRLRNRIQTGMQDFAYLADPERFSEHDVDLLVDDETEKARFNEGLKEMIAFIYRVEPAGIESIVEEGVQRGVNRCFPEYKVDDVSIKVRKRERILEQARDQMDNGEPLTDAQVRAMLQDGDLPLTELQEYVQSHPDLTNRKYRNRFR